MEGKHQVNIPERKNIDIREDHELQHWSHRFGISKEELRKTIEEVGTVSKALEAYLRKNKGDLSLK
jgi:hypothetical protein